MKKRLFWILIIVLMFAFGFTMAGCGGINNDGTDGNLDGTVDDGVTDDGTVSDGDLDGTTFTMQELYDATLWGNLDSTEQLSLAEYVEKNEDALIREFFIDEAIDSFTDEEFEDFKQECYEYGTGYYEVDSQDEYYDLGISSYYVIESVVIALEFNAGTNDATKLNSLQKIEEDEDYAYLEYNGIHYLDVGYSNMLLGNYVDIDGLNISLDGKSVVGYSGQEGELTLPNGIEEIKAEALYGNSIITSLVFSNTVTHIKDYAFSTCKNLKTVVLGEKITTIYEGAFDRCESLASITVPSSAKEIGKYTFSNCTNLTSVTFEDTNNWYFAKSVVSDATAADVTDAETNATNLTKTYVTYGLYKMM